MLSTKTRSTWNLFNRLEANITRLAIMTALCSLPISAQQTNAQRPSAEESSVDLRGRVGQLEREVAELRAELRAVKASMKNSATGQESSIVTAESHVSEASSAGVPDPPVAQPASAGKTESLSDYLKGTTFNVGIDTYYTYNFNTPIGRVNLLRAYDVLSNNISLNQASLVMERAPDPASGRRIGTRLDLQYGQATDTLQGNPLNEPRPDIYRNIFQAYGTWVMPVGSGLNIDVGKWGSSLGIEGNYSKDQINYSRALWFNFLPFYHMGVRANYKFNDQIAANYWLVNGTNQTEATNGFKDQLFGLLLTPRKSISWTINYYLGQEHPDRTLVPSTGFPPVQPGLSFAAIRPAPDGRTHIFDSYVSWQATSKLTTALEGDYFIQRDWKHAAPGRSAAPSHAIGGAAYAKYQLNSRNAVGARAEYMSDRGGLFSGITQALKETTLTYDYKVADGLLMRYEWRRDFSNQPYFLTHVPNVLREDQNTATLGLIWWFGQKEGSW